MRFQFPAGFDPQPTLPAEQLSLRPLKPKDRDALWQAARDPAIWEGHPAHNRHERTAFDPYFDGLLGTKGALAIRQADYRMIGCSVYYTDPNAPSRLSIGFTFLTCDHWGGQTNRIVKRLMLGHLFDAASEAWFHIAPSNTRSQIATTRLGAVHTHYSEADLGAGNQLWGCYCLSRERWSTILNQAE